MTVGLLLVSCTGRSGDPLPPDGLVGLKNTGGIAGIDEKLIVSRQGKVTFTSRRLTGQRTAQLTPEELGSLKQALEKADLRTLPRPTEPAQGPVDYLYRGLIYPGGAADLNDTRSVAALAPVFRQLEPLMARLRP